MSNIVNKDANVINGRSKHDLIMEALAVLRRDHSHMGIMLHNHGDKVWSLEIDKHVKMKDQTEDQMFKVLTGMIIASKYL